MNQYADSPITTKFVSESLEIDSIRVTLEWTQENMTLSLYSFSVSISPQVPILVFPEGTTRVQLKVHYETLYNVSFQAIPFCKQGNTTIFIRLYYSELISFAILMIHKIIKSILFT